jgi:hypothetical protein
MDAGLKHRLAEGWLPLTLDGKELYVASAKDLPEPAR